MTIIEEQRLETLMKLKYRTVNIPMLIASIALVGFTYNLSANIDETKVNMLAQKGSKLEAYIYINDVEEGLWSLFSEIDINIKSISLPTNKKDIKRCETLSENLDGLTSLYSKLMDGNIYHLKKKISHYSKMLTNCFNAKIEAEQPKEEIKKSHKNNLLNIVNEDLKLSELDMEDLKIVVTADITLPGKLQSHSNRTFVFSDGNLITPIQGASTYYEHSVNQPKCEIFTYADLDAPVTIKKGTIFKVRVNDIVNSDVSISNLEFNSLKNWETIHSITCSRGYTPKDNRGSSSPIPSNDFKVAELHKHFGHSIILASSKGSGPSVNQINNASINFPSDKLSMNELMGVELKIIKEQVLETQTASGWSLVYNNKHYFFSNGPKYFDTLSLSGAGNYVAKAPFDDNFDFSKATRNELVCYISFYRDNKTDFTFREGEAFKLTQEYRLENTLLLEFNNHNKSSQKPRFIRCYRDSNHQNKNEITLEEVEKTFGFIKIEK